jgi:hypothetical protein
MDVEEASKRKQAKVENAIVDEIVTCLKWEESLKATRSRAIICEVVGGVIEGHHTS